MADFIAKTVPEIEYHGLIASGAMTADHSRNLIADDFLNTSAEWLFWIDSDTLVPAGALSRLLALGKTLASGLYFGKNPPHPPIAYYRNAGDGTYMPIDRMEKWEKGEILPVDAVGMGCVLTHRSVFEDIKANFRMLQLMDGGITVVHNSDLVGALEKNGKSDGKVIRGQYRQRLMEPTITNLRFPFFMIGNLRTEDIHFFDIARRAGHKVWLDTSIECGHLRPVPLTGKDYREIYGY